MLLPQSNGSGHNNNPREQLEITLESSINKLWDIIVKLSEYDNHHNRLSLTNSMYDFLLFIFFLVGWSFIF